jgi:hypothetical protein
MDLTSKTVQVATPTSNTHPATKGYVDTEVANLIDSAPGTLDTLNELAAAVNDDANFAATVTTGLSEKLPLAGGTMTGVIAGFESTGIDDNAANTSVTILSNGRVGIGIESPARILDVDSGVASDIARFGNDSGGYTLGYTTDLASIDLSSSAGIRVRSGSTIALQTTSDGRVGVGEVSPDYRLEVKGLATTNTDIVGFSNSNGVAKHIFGLENVGAGRYSILDGSNNTAVFFSGHDADNSYINAGHFGIGTTSPDVKFEVQDDSTWDTANFTSSSTVGAGLTLAATDTGTKWSLIAQGTTGGGNDNNLGFHLTNAGTSGQGTGYKFVMTPSGRFGIGTTSPTSELHVNGAIKSSLIIASLENPIRSSSDADNYFTYTPEHNLSYSTWDFTSDERIAFHARPSYGNSGYLRLGKGTNAHILPEGWTGTLSAHLHAWSGNFATEVKVQTKPLSSSTWTDRFGTGDNGSSQYNQVGSWVVSSELTEPHAVRFYFVQNSGVGTSSGYCSAKNITITNLIDSYKNVNQAITHHNGDIGINQQDPGTKLEISDYKDGTGNNTNGVGLRLSSTAGSTGSNSANGGTGIEFTGHGHNYNGAGTGTAGSNPIAIRINPVYEYWGQNNDMSNFGQTYPYLKFDFKNSNNSSYITPLLVSGLSNGRVAIGNDTTSVSHRLSLGSDAKPINYRVSGSGGHAIADGTYEENARSFSLGGSDTAFITEGTVSNSNKWRVRFEGDFGNNYQGGGLNLPAAVIYVTNTQPTVYIGSTNITVSRDSGTGKLQVTNQSSSYAVHFTGKITVWDHPQSNRPTFDSEMQAISLQGTDDYGTNLYGGLIMKTPAYSEYHFQWSGTQNHSLTFTCASYQMSTMEYTSHQTNGGADIHKYVFGKWGNNHTSHNWNQMESNGSTWGLTTTFTATDQSGGSSQANGKLVINETYSGGSVSTRTLVVKTYYGGWGLTFA